MGEDSTIEIAEDARAAARIAMIAERLANESRRAPTKAPADPRIKARAERRRRAKAANASRRKNRGK